MTESKVFTTCVATMPATNRRDEIKCRLPLGHEGKHHGGGSVVIGGLESWVEWDFD